VTSAYDNAIKIVRFRSAGHRQSVYLSELSNQVLTIDTISAIMVSEWAWIP